MEWLSKLLENLKFSTKQKDVILSCFINFLLIFLMLFICAPAFREYELIKETILALSISLVLHLISLFAIFIFENIVNSKYDRLSIAFFIPCHALPIFVIISSLQGAEYSQEELVKIFTLVFLFFYGLFICSGFIGRVAAYVVKIFIDKKRTHTKKEPQEPCDNAEDDESVL